MALSMTKSTLFTYFGRFNQSVLQNNVSSFRQHVRYLSKKKVKRFYAQNEKGPIEQPNSLSEQTKGLKQAATKNPLVQQKLQRSKSVAARNAILDNVAGPSRDSESNVEKVKTTHQVKQKKKTDAVTMNSESTKVGTVKQEKKSSQNREQLQAQSTQKENSGVHENAPEHGMEDLRTMVKDPSITVTENLKTETFPEMDETHSKKVTQDTQPVGQSVGDSEIQNSVKQFLTNDNLQKGMEIGHKGKTGTTQSFKSMINKNFEKSKKLVLVEYSASKTDEDVLNYIEASSGKIKAAYELGPSKNKDFKLLLVQFENKKGRELSRYVGDDHLLVMSLYHKPEMKCKAKVVKIKEPFTPDLLMECKDVSAQIVKVYQEARLSTGMILYQFFVVNLLNHELEQVIKQIVPLVFGSAASGIALSGLADIDVCVYCQTEDKVESLRKMAKRLKHCNWFNKVQPILRARVPIVTLNDKFLNISCDISMNNFNGPLMAESVYILNLYDERFHPLVLTLKYWAKVNNVLQKPGFSNHMLTMLIICYLQTRGVLPPLKDLYINEYNPEESDEMETPYFHRVRMVQDLARKRAPGHEASLADLLKGFFQYYQDFQFRDRVIDIHSGTVREREHMFQALILDPHAGKHNVFRNTKMSHIHRFRYFCAVSHGMLCSDEKEDNGEEKWGLQKILPVTLSEFDIVNVFMESEDQNVFVY